MRCCFTVKEREKSKMCALQRDAVGQERPCLTLVIEQSGAEQSSQFLG